METEKEVSSSGAIQLGIEMHQAGRLKEAESLFRAALHAGGCDEFACHFWIGICCFEQKQIYEAKYRFERALKITKRHPVATANLGMVLSEMGHQAEAEGELRKALHLNPSSHIARVNLASVLVRQDRFEEGLQMALAAAKLQPNDDIAHFNAGIALYSMNRVEESIAAYDRALKANPRNAEATYNKANALMKVGRLKEGFQLYDSRLSTDQAGNYHYFKPTAPWWKGEPLYFKTLLIHGEQGIGDSIMFMRFVDHIRGKPEFRTTRFVVVPHTALLTIAQEHWRADDQVTVHSAKDKQYPAHDFYTFLMSIPGRLGTDFDTLPEPWNFSESQRGCEDWGRFGINDPTFNKTRVGICWSGNWIHKNDAHRSLTLEQFAQIIRDNPDIEFHSLQKEVRQGDEALLKELGIKDHRAELTDMRETAHLIGFMDKVISVDTAVAHLAASKDVKTFILLPLFRTDWRWMQYPVESPWYPSVTLIRQDKIGDWSGPVKLVAKAIASKAAIAA